MGHWRTRALQQSKETYPITLFDHLRDFEAERLGGL
jgi:hypothetical protein